MAKVRVSTLAKEFGMTSKELMGHLADMKIPAKSASSTLEDAYVAMVRKQLASVIEARAQEVEAAKQAEEQAAAAEEAARAAEAERERIAAEKAREEERRQFAAAQAAEEVARAEAEAVRYNVTVRRFCFDQYDRSSFESLLETLRREEFDGAVIATLFAEMVEPFTRELDARGVPYVFVDSDIPACNRLAYFGTSSFDAGAVAARLLFDRLDPGADIVVGRIVHRGDAGSNQWRNREAGFRSYLEAHAFRGRLHYAALRLDDEACNGRVLDEMFRENPSIAGAVTFNSTCYILAGYLAARRRDGVRLVGYDVIRRNGEMLSAGVVTALVAQRPEAQGYRAVMALCEWLVEGRAPSKVNNMPIDILLKENIPYYKNNII